MFFTVSSSQKVLEVNSPLYSPLQVDGSLLFCSINGQIIRYSESQLKLFTKVNGQIRGIAYDGTKNTYYVSDLLKQSVIAINAQDAAESELVSEFEGVPLEGPHSMIVSSKTGNLFFTDCGAFGESNIPNTKGSLFLIDMQQQTLKAITLRSLSNPTGLAFANNQQLIYLAETGKNRLLRFYQSPQGIFYLSVFHQFNGRFGPTTVAVTPHDILICALFQFKTLSNEGFLAFLNKEGELLQRLRIPQCGPEISGLFISRQTEQDMSLLITQNSGRQSCHKLMIKVQKINKV